NGGNRANCGDGSFFWAWDFCWRNGTFTIAVSMSEPAMSSSIPDSSPATAGLRRVLESKDPKRRSFADYRRYIQRHYDGLPGALTAVTGRLTGHETLAGRLIRPDAFDVRGCKRFLDAGCGNGRYSKFLLAAADAGALLT